MNLIKQFRVIIAIVLPVLILVLLRSFGGNQFKIDAKKWAEPSVLKTNIISPDQVAKLIGNKLFINLDQNPDIPGSVRKHGGPVLLSSAEPAVSARIWMILSQMGYRNVYILTAAGDNEILK